MCKASNLFSYSTLAPWALLIISTCSSLQNRGHWYVSAAQDTGQERGRFGGRLRAGLKDCSSGQLLKKTSRVLQSPGAADHHVTRYRWEDQRGLARSVHLRYDAGLGDPDSVGPTDHHGMVGDLTTHVYAWYATTWKMLWALDWSTRWILQESVAKEREDRKETLGEGEAVMGDETSLFYSDIMPLLVSMPMQRNYWLPVCQFALSSHQFRNNNNNNNNNFG